MRRLGLMLLALFLLLLGSGVVCQFSGLTDRMVRDKVARLGYPQEDLLTYRLQLYAVSLVRLAGARPRQGPDDHGNSWTAEVLVLGGVPLLVKPLGGYGLDQASSS